MPVYSIAAKNKLLDATIGNDTPPTGIPASYWLALFSSDPSLEAEPTDVELELDVGGYARIEIPNTSAVWDGASSAEKHTIVDFSIGPSVGAWSDTITHAGLMDTESSAVPGELWDYTELASPVTVANAGLTITFPAGSFVIRHV